MNDGQTCYGLNDELFNYSTMAGALEYALVDFIDENNPEYFLIYSGEVVNVEDPEYLEDDDFEFAVKNIKEIKIKITKHAKYFHGLEWEVVKEGEV